jgi:hypothetical protein
MGIRNLFASLLRSKDSDYVFGLIDRGHIGASHERTPLVRENAGDLILVAVAGGCYRAQTVLVHARIGRSASGDPLHNLDVMQVESLGVPDPAEVAEHIADRRNALPGAQVLIHVGGQGITVARLLTHVGIPHRRINWGDQSSDPTLRKTYRNVKAQAYESLVTAFHRHAITFQCEPPLYLYQDAARIGRRVHDDRIEYASANLVGQFEGIDLLDCLAAAYLDGLTWTVAPAKVPPVVAALRAEAQRAAPASSSRFDSSPAPVDSMGLGSTLHPLNPLSPYNSLNQQAALADEPRRHEPEPVRCMPSSHSSSDYGSSYSSYDSGSSGYSSYSSDSGSSCSGSSGCD